MSEAANDPANDPQVTPPKIVSMLMAHKSYSFQLGLQLFQNQRSTFER